jgi:hypothetical protein
MQKIAILFYQSWLSRNSFVLVSLCLTRWMQRHFLKVDHDYFCPILSHFTILVHLLLKMWATDIRDKWLTLELTLTFLDIFQVHLLLHLAVYKNSMFNVSIRHNTIWNLVTQAAVLPTMLSRKHSLVHVATKCITGGLTSGGMWD